ncbi:hypothetical protein [Pseudomonas syringae group genomosp. 3]|uniref:hypothetical protein n=1 Tax=Pseudomonas syringae group genomosp. 3 TaxID=251701 RepID=UPI000622923A|nr:hypothetical protein [Pseudomonas syringae group genomosp. 3]KKI25447.1 hypothetical protein WX98_14595 [Pseudomonas syringae pv. persicae]MBF9245809.1 hypothetical protein [Pseudomonas syringae pv. tomato]MBM0209202.1 hypothetical protein [Pseudomonas syringae pv. maculicola]RMM80298.1 Type III restriction protein res subunit [Pseudomonas syringae pv. maculicola]
MLPADRTLDQTSTPAKAGVFVCVVLETHKWSGRPRRLDENPEHGIEADAVTDAKLEMCKGDFAEHPDCYSVPRGTHYREKQAGVFHPVSEPSRSKLAV